MNQLQREELQALLIDGAGMKLIINIDSIEHDKDHQWLMRAVMLLLEIEHLRSKC